MKRRVRLSACLAAVGCVVGMVLSAHAVADPPGSISGVVTSAQTGQPIAGLSVLLADFRFEPSRASGHAAPNLSEPTYSTAYVDSVRTDASGHYTFAGLSAQDYEVCFYGGDPLSGPVSYGNKCFDNHDWYTSDPYPNELDPFGMFNADGDTISLAAGQNRSGVSAALGGLEHIQGSVRSPDGLPVSTVAYAYEYDSVNNYYPNLFSAPTAADGTFDIAVPKNATYAVCVNANGATDGNPTDGFGSGCYGNFDWDPVADGNPPTMAARLAITNQSVSGIDVTLPFRPSITASSATITVGHAAPKITYLLGHLGNDSLTGLPTCGVDNFDKDRAGTYTTSCTAALTSGQPILSITGTLTSTFGFSSGGLPANYVGKAYSGKLVAEGGIGTVRYALTGGALPAGIKLAANGAFSGTPTASGQSTFSVTATDSAPVANTTTQAVTITILPLAISTPSFLDVAEDGVAYSVTLHSVGGKGTLAYAVTSGALPAGLKLTSGGVISGKPYQNDFSDEYHFTVTVHDSSKPVVTDSRVFTIEETGMFLNDPFPLTSQYVSPIDEKIPGGYKPTGGFAPFTYAVTAGALPAGLTIAKTTGAFTGAPTVTGDFPFTVTVTDAKGATSSVADVLHVVAMSVNGGDLPFATHGKSYSFNFVKTVAGGRTAYSFALVGGTLPEGLKLSKAGVLSGTAKSAGDYTFTVQVTDSTKPTPNVATGVLTLSVE